MRHLARQVLTLGLLIGMPAVAQQPAGGDGSGTVPTTAPSYGPTSLKAVTVYLHRTDGRWSASLSGDVKDPATEKIEVLLADGSLRVMTRSLPNGSRLCLTKMKDRAEFGYLECNSAFYSANAGSTAAATVLRGVLSFGILTATDAASGSTGFTVSLNQPALDAAVAESRAIELARESAPLIEYRDAFTRAWSPRQLRSFIATYEGVFDPESLVAKAKEKVPAAIEQEEVRARQKAAGEAQLAELERQKETQRQAQLEALRLFQSGLRPGDRVMMKLKEGYPVPYVYGMVVEMKPPLAYLQWEIVTPSMQWVRLDNLLPPR